MSVAIKYLAHNNTKNHDKIWGVIHTDAGAYSFWGRRGYTVAMKKLDDGDDGMHLYYKKLDKDYKAVPSNKITALLPENFEQTLLLAILGQHR